MKPEEKHKFSYIHLIFISSFAGFLGFMTVPNWTRQRTEDLIISAKRQAEVLGYQIFEIYQEERPNSLGSEILNLRSPASMGTTGGSSFSFHEMGRIGKDPWNQPYRYKILNTAAEGHLKVQIWSAGPNKVFETKDLPGVATDSYAGDDVGITLSLNQNPSE
ncbi:MAG: hypothetical protein ACXWRE_05660 [Pseudobdellovibrionaceae bacterium]